MTIFIKRLRGDDWQQRSIRLKALQSDPTAFSSSYHKEFAMTEAEWKARFHDDAAIFLLHDDAAPMAILSTFGVITPLISSNRFLSIASAVSRSRCNWLQPLEDS
jgi:hypothetical protein